MAKISWLNVTLSRIASGELAEADIQVIRKRVSAALSRQHDAKITEAEARTILDALSDRQPRVTEAQARKGAEWLYKVVFTPSGKRRRTELAAQFSEADIQVIQALKDCPRFDIVGLRVISAGYSRVAVFPAYRAIGHGGASFCYMAAAWQSGGASFVERHAL